MGPVSKGVINPRNFEVLMIYSSSFFGVQLLISLGVTEKKVPGY
jgi:hypothetical protein